MTSQIDTANITNEKTADTMPLDVQQINKENNATCEVYEDVHKRCDTCIEIQ